MGEDLPQETSTPETMGAPPELDAQVDELRRKIPVEEEPTGDQSPEAGASERAEDSGDTAEAAPPAVEAVDQPVEMAHDQTHEIPNEGEDQGGWDPQKAETLGRTMNTPDWLDSDGKSVIDRVIERRGTVAPEEQREVDDQTVEYVLSLPERLYDMSPDHFANMPTSEFMTAVHRFEPLQRRVERGDWGCQTLGRVLDFIDKNRRERTVTSAHDAESVAIWLARFTGVSERPEGDELVAQVKNFFEHPEATPDNYDMPRKSPQEMNEAFRAFVQQHFDTIRTRRDGAQSELANFLRSEGIESSIPIPKAS